MVKDVGGSIKDLIYHGGGGGDPDDSGGGNDGSSSSSGVGGGSGGGVGGGGGDALTSKPISSQRNTQKQRTECYLPCAISLPPHTLSSTESNTLANTHATSRSGVSGVVGEDGTSFQYLSFPGNPFDDDDDDDAGFNTSTHPPLSNGQEQSQSNDDNDEKNKNTLLLVAGSQPTEKMNKHSHRSLRVLIVDDSIPNQTVLKEFFLSQGVT